MKAKINYSFKDINHEEWANLLNRTSYGSFFQSSEAFLFLSKIQGNDPFIVSIESSGKLLGIVTGIIQYESGVFKSAFTRRAIIYGGPLISDEIKDEELGELLSTLVNHLKNKAIYIEIRNFHDFSKHKKVFTEAGFQYKKHINFKVNCSNRDDMMKRMSKSKKRQIKKGLKEGAEITEASEVNEIVCFYKILENLYKEKVKTPLFPIEFFTEFFKMNLGKYFLVKYKEEIIGGIMCPRHSNKTIYEWFVCGKDEEYRHLYPSILATWAAMDYANNNNIEIFDFMGAGSPEANYGVREFKSKFGGDLVEEGRFIYVLSPILYLAGKTGVKLLKKH